LAAQQFLPRQDLWGSPERQAAGYAGGIVPGAQEVHEAASGHDVGGAKTQLVLDFAYFIFPDQ
jgi:hypothetical protein